VALDKLASLPQVDSGRLAMIGYCMGGTFSLELARDGAPLKGVVSFHGGLDTKRPAELGKTKAKILVCHGSDDPFVQMAAVNAFVEEMTKAGADWQLISYGGTVHSFTNPDADRLGVPGLAYNKQTDERSWKAMRAFFDEIFA
jgi:dienelactone hydrolase